MKKIIILSNTISSTKSFRMPLIEWIKKRGYDVSLVVFGNGDDNSLDGIVSNVFHIDISNSSTSPLSILKAKKQLSSLFKAEKPDLVLTFQIMANVIGSLACPKGVPVIAMVEGRGRIFQLPGLNGVLVRKFASDLMKRSFRHCLSVYFLNQSDIDFFSQLLIVPKEKAKLMHGIGVDLDRFSFKPLKKFNTVVMVSRLLKSKGVFDFCEAAGLVKKKNDNLHFKLVGPLGDVTEGDLAPYIREGTIEWNGPRSDIENVYWDSAITVLPTTYGEGFPMTLMESCACGRPCVAYDVPGCRDAIVNGLNGYLVHPNNVSELAKTIDDLLSDCAKLQKMSVAAAKYASSEWKFEQVQREYLKQIDDVLNDRLT